MSLTIFPINRKDRKDKFLFCFNPSPLQPINDEIAVEGYLTEDDAKNVLNGWGIKILKQCYQYTDRTIIEDGARWPFFGLPVHYAHRKGKSLYEVFKEKKLI